jgi:hypothetical protein
MVVIIITEMEVEEVLKLVLIGVVAEEMELLLYGG